MSLRLALPLLAALALPAQTFTSNLITTVAGTDPSFANGVDALRYPLPPGFWGKPAADAAGNLYFALTNQHIVVRLSPAGRLDRVAGTGFARFGGDGGPATAAALNSPRGVAVDSRGWLYIADNGNRRIRRVSLSRGTIETFAGGGTAVPTANGTPLSAALIATPSALAIDATDNLYVAFDSTAIARVDYGATSIRLYAGRPGTPGTPTAGPAASSLFRLVASLSTDRAGNLYAADAQSISIVRINPAGRLEVLTTRSATFGAPTDLVADPAGTVYFVQNASPVIWRLQTNNSVDIYSGDPDRAGYTPNGTPRERALYGEDLRIGLDAKGLLVVADLRSARLRRVSATVDAILGPELLYAGEGAPATAALFYNPVSLAQNRAGTLYVSDPAARLVFAIDSRGVFRRFAGSGVLNAPYVDGRSALEGAFGAPYGVAVDAAGNVYVADDDCAVRRIGTDGAMRLFAGTPGACGMSRDGVAPREFRFGQLRGLVFDGAGNLYISDITNHKVWRIGADGVIRTFAGTGQPGTSTTSLPAVQTPLNTPLAVAASADGSVYIADSQNHRVVRVGPEGRSTVFAGLGLRASTGDNGPASGAAVNQPGGLAVDGQGNLYIAEMGGHRVRRVNSSGTISLFAGTGAPGFRGDGGFAVNALLDTPTGLLVNPAGDLLIADRENHRIRRVLSAPPAVRISTTPVSVSLPDGEFLRRGSLALPAPIPGINFEATVRYAATPPANWLTVVPTRGALPVNLGYEVNTAGLPPGDYTASIVITVPNGTPRETIVPLSVRVPNRPARSWFTSANQRLTLASPRGGSASYAVPITNPNAAPIVIQSAVLRGAYLSVSPAEITVPPGQTGTFTILANAGNLTAGTYAGAVAFSGSNVTATVAIAYNVFAAASRLTISQTGLSFLAVAGGAAPSEQVLYAPEGRRVTVTTATTAGADWLSASADGNRVTVAVDPAGLNAGDFYGRVVVADEANPAQRQTATVILQVLPPGSEPSPEIGPAALVFTAAPGLDAAGQEITVSLLSNRQGSFTATAASQDGAAWLQISPASGPVSGGAPARITVQPDLSSLAAGVYRGAVTVTLDDGQSRTVSVLAVVANPVEANAKTPDRAASGCTNPNLFPQVIAPPANFSATTGQPVRLAARVVDGCGNAHQPEGGGNAGVAVTGLGSQVVNLTHIGGGVWEATVTPNSTQDPVTLTYLALFTRGTFLAAGAEKVSGGIGNAVRPLVFADSLTDAASFQFGVPVAPGTLVSLFGSNLNPQNAIPTTLPLPSRLDDVEVRLNDVPIPLLFAGPGQVNAQIPYTLAADTEYQLEIRRGNAITTPQPVVIAQARPGVFTIDQSGQGQGHIYRALTDGSQRLASASDPAGAGDIVVIYCNGLGSTNPSVAAGAAAPASPLAVTANPVSVTVGGQPVTILFAGLAPGFTGLYQINAQLPAGISPGADVPMVITVAGQSSVPVTMGVR
jgi:uncharacterized protein (TIGR03437 family)